MTHHQFGTMVGEHNGDGIFNLVGSVLLGHKATLAVSKGEKGMPAGLIVLETSGEIVGPEDHTLQAVWVMSAMDAGQLARMLHDACGRLSEDEQSDFRVGWNHPDDE